MLSMCLGLSLKSQLGATGSSYSEAFLTLAAFRLAMGEELLNNDEVRLRCFMGLEDMNLTSSLILGRSLDMS